LSAILVKPETAGQKYIQVPNVVANADEFGAFDVIGFTEKELGDSFLARMASIAKIRLALDAARVASPIHVFGSLDPISVPLYFLAGAEIFDGLTWLRYAYEDGRAVYRHNFSARQIGVHRRDDFVKLKTIQDNLSSLLDLTNEMRRFLIDGDFEKFGPNAKTIRVAVDLLKTKVGG
jgi:predicted RNA-binding protein